MFRVAAFVLMLIGLASNSFAASALFSNLALEATIEALFSPELTLIDVKFAVDETVYPAATTAVVKAQFEDLALKLEAMVPAKAAAHDKLKILRKFIYEAGAWNDGRPFTYDQTDPLGKNTKNKTLAQYMTSRSGNCISMPILFVLLGKRIGLDLKMATAPYHAFVKFTDDEKRDWNLEATSGAGFTRDSHYRKELPMTDEAVAKGTYLRALPREQEVALVATILVEHYFKEKMAREVIVAASVLLKHYPNSAQLLIYQGSAYAMILQQEIVPRYKTRGDMPPDVQEFADAVWQRNQEFFQAAEAIGWRENEGQAGVQP
jgi:regulator of sirC expression with transglutaminase-like and TPR domain